MRQMELVGPHRLEPVEAAMPSLHAGDVLVETQATAICGTDVHIYTGHTAVSYPRVPGHEVAGTVREVGSTDSAFSPGDRVAVNPNLDCGRCERCIVGKENICSLVRLLGRETDGTLREYLTVPERNAFPLTSAVPVAAGPLIQPLSTVTHGNRLAGVTPADSVVVLGLGATGLMHVRLAKLEGAYPVIGIGRSRWKLDLAEQMEADHIVDASSGDPVAEVMRLTGGHGADVVIEAVGIPETFQQALDMMKPGGRVVGFGISPQPFPSMDMYRRYLTETTIVFPRAATRSDFYRAVALVESGRVDLSPLVTREYALEDAASAFRYAEEERGSVLRLVFTP